MSVFMVYWNHTQENKRPTTLCQCLWLIEIGVPYWLSLGKIRGSQQSCLKLLGFHSANSYVTPLIKIQHIER